MEEQLPNKVVRVVDMAAMQALARTTCLAEVRLVQMSCKASGPVTCSADETDQTVRFRGGVAHRANEALAGWISFSYLAKVGEAKIVELEGTFLVLYDVMEEASIEAQHVQVLNQFVEVMGVLNTWPYIREVVASTAARLGLACVTLPTWRVPPELPPEGEYASMDKPRTEPRSPEV